MELNNAVWKFLHRKQPQRYITLPGCNQGNALSDERRHDGDDELVNRVHIQERRLVSQSRLPSVRAMYSSALVAVLTMIFRLGGIATSISGR